MPQTQTNKRKSFEELLDEERRAPAPSPSSPPTFEQLLEQDRTRPKSFEQLLAEDLSELGRITVEGVMSLPGAQSVMSAAAPAFKFLGAPGHGSSTWFDSAITDAKKVWDDASLLLSSEFYARRRAETKRAIYETFQAFGEPLGLSAGPPKRTNFHDVIRNQAPDFKAEHPVAAGALGFAGDVLLDPLSWLSLGTAKGVTVGGRALTREGEKALAATSKALRKGEAPKVPAGLDVSDLIGTPIQPGAIRETSEKIIQRVAESAPDLDKALFDLPGWRVRLSPIFSRAGVDVPGTRAAGQAVKDAAKKLTSRETAEALRLGRLYDKVEELKTARDLPEEYIERRNWLIDQRNAVTEDVVDATRAIAKDLTKDEQQAVSSLMARIERGREELESRLGRALSASEGNELLRREFSQVKLTPKQMGAIAKMQQGYKESAELEDLAGQVGEAFKAYDPRLHEIVSDPGRMQRLLDEGPNLGPEDFRLFDELDQAKLSQGKEPEMEAFLQYATRVVEARKRAARRQFDDSVEAIFGTRDRSELPRLVQKDIQYFGDGVYPLTDAVSAMPIMGWLFNKFYKPGLSLWKRGATSLNPAFGPKNFVSDTLQGAAVLGAKAFRGFDPRSFIDAAIVGLEFAPKLIGRERATLQLPEFASNWVKKHFAEGQTGVDSVLASRVATRNLFGAERLKDYASQYRMVSAIGEDIPGEQLAREIREQGVTPGFDASGERFTHSLKRRIGHDPNSFPSVAWELIKWWNWPSILQDLTRSALYINGRRMGYTPSQSSAMVNKALFDYQKGLKPFEQQVVKNAIPFYSFQRFSIPFVLKQAMTRPGQIDAVNDFTTLAEKLLVTGEEPTEAEREIFGDTYLAERPRVFRGFDKDGKAAFNVLNNITPLDSISLFVTKPDGSLDYRRSVEKMTLAAMTPFLKLPIEHLINRSFFTGQTLDRAGKLGEVNQSTLSRVLPDPVKDLMSWEVRADSSGREVVYVNPYLAHWAMGLLPAVRNYIRAGEPGQTPLEAALEAIGATETKKLDLREEQERQELRDDQILSDLRRRFRRAETAADIETKRGQDRLKDAEDDMLRFLDAVDRKRLRLSQLGSVRGAGLPEQPPEK